MIASYKFISNRFFFAIKRCQHFTKVYEFLVILFIQLIAKQENNLENKFY